MKKKLIRLLAFMLATMLSTSSLLSVSAEETLGGNTISTVSEEPEETVSYSKTIEFGIGQGISSIPYGSNGNYCGYTSQGMFIGVPKGGVTGEDGDWGLKVQVANVNSSTTRRSPLFTYGDYDEDGSPDVLPAGEYELVFWAKGVDAVKKSYETADSVVKLSFHGENVVDLYTDSSGSWEERDSNTYTEGYALNYGMTYDNPEQVDDIYNTIATVTLFDYKNSSYVAETGNINGSWKEYKTTVTLTETAVQSAIWVFIGEKIAKVDNSTYKIDIDRLSITPIYTIEFVDEKGTTLLNSGENTTKYIAGTSITPPAPSKDADDNYAYTFSGWYKWDAEASAWGTELIASNAITTATADARYKAVYTATERYTVTFQNEAGETLTDESKVYAKDEVVTPPAQSKASTETATYEFLGWAEWDTANNKFADEAEENAAKTITVTKNATYRPVFKEHEKVTVTVPFGRGQGITTIANKYYGYRHSVVLGATGGLSGATDDWYLSATMYGDANSLNRRTKLFEYGDNNEDGSTDILPAGTYEVTFWAQSIESTKSGYAGLPIRIVLSFHKDNVLDWKTDANGSSWETVPDSELKEGEVFLNYDMTSENTITTLDLFNYAAKTYSGETGETKNGWTQYKTIVTLPETATQSAIWIIRTDAVEKVADCDDKIWLDELTIASLDTAEELRTIEFLNDDDNNTLFEAKQYLDGAAVTLPFNTPVKEKEGYRCDFKGWVKWDEATSAWDTANLITSDSQLTVNGNATFKAVYDEVEMCVITFQNYDDSVITKLYLNNGETIEVPDDPKKTETADYTYTFMGWVKWDKEAGAWGTEVIPSNAITTASESVTYKASFKEVKKPLSIVNDVGDYTYFNNIYCNTRKELYENTSFYPKTNKITCTRFQNNAYKDKDRTTHILFEKSTTDDCYFDIKVQKLSYYNSTRTYQYFKMTADVMLEDSADAVVQLFRLKDTTTEPGTTIWGRLANIEADGRVKLQNDKYVQVNGEDFKVPTGEYTSFTISMNLKDGMYNVYLNGSTEPVAKDVPLAKNFENLDVVRFAFNKGTGKLYLDNCEVTGLIEPYESGIMTSIFPVDDAEEAYLADKVSFHAYAELMYKKANAEDEKATKIALTAKPVYESEAELFISAEDASKAFDKTITCDGTNVYIDGNAANVDVMKNEDGITVISVNALADALGLYHVDDGQGMVIVSKEELTLDVSGELPFYLKEYTGSCEVVYPTVVESLNRFLFFERPEAEEIKTLFNANTNNGTAHPRIQATAEDFARIKDAYEKGTDETLKQLIELALEKADATAESTVKFDYTYDDDMRTYDTASALKKNMQWLGFGWQMTGEQKYIDRAWELFEAMSTFPDFNTSHVIDAGMYCMAGAIGYDWMYDGFTKEQREIIEETVISLGIEPLGSAYYGRLTSTAGGNVQVAGAQPKWTSNYNTVVTTGFLAATLAFADKLPDDQAFDYVEKGLRAIEATMYGFVPDGGWVEGLAYWDYTARYLMYGISSLQTACGTDFGLMKYNGLDTTCDFLISQTSLEGWNNFHDANLSKTLSWCPYNYMAGLYNKPYYQDLRCYALVNGIDNINVMDVLYYSTESGYDESRLENIDKVTVTTGVESFSIREDFLSDDGLFLAGHFGATTAYHSHCDTGAFVLDMLGERWALDLGKEDYNTSVSGSKLYRKRAEGHNTLFIQNTKSLEQVGGVFAPIVRSEENENSAFVVADCTGIYSGMSSYMRGFYVGDGMTSVTVRDEFTVKESDTTVYWTMHTAADIQKVSDTELELIQNGKVLSLKVDTNATAVEVTGTTATPLEGSPSLEGQTENTGINKVLIKLTCTGDVGLSVKIAPKGEYADTTPIHSEAMANWTTESTADAAADTDYSFKFYIDGQESDSWYIPVVNGKVLEITELRPNNPNNTVEYEDIDTDDDGVDDIRIYKIYDANHRYYRTIKVPHSSSGSALLKYYDEIKIASIVVSDEPEAANPGINAIDGDLTTRWFTGNKDLKNNEPEYAILDLGSVQDVDAVAISSWKGNVRAYNYAIYTSVDGENYEHAVTYSGTGTTEEPEIGMFAQTTPARYIKYVAMGNSVNTYSNVFEFLILKAKEVEEDTPSEESKPSEEAEPSEEAKASEEDKSNNDGEDETANDAASRDSASSKETAAAAPTGDESNPGLWLMLLVGSVCTVAALFVFRRKTK